MDAVGKVNVMSFELSFRKYNVYNNQHFFDFFQDLCQDL